MAIDVTMPRLSMTMDEAEIIEWLKKEGDPVQAGEPILTITTDKANVEVSAEASGILTSIRARVGETVAVGAVIAQISDKTAATPQVSPVAQRMAEANGVDVSKLQGSGPRGKIMEADVRAVIEMQPAAEADAWVRATPYARTLAKRSNMPLNKVKSSHYTGRVVGRDVERFIATQAASPSTAAFQAAAQLASAAITRSKVSPAALASASVRESHAMSGIRGTIARRMAASAQTTAPVTIATEADATALVDARARLKASATEWGFAPTYNDLIIKAIALSLRYHPALNARLNGDQIEYLADINVGLAVDTERGLLVPVLPQINNLGLRGIGEMTRDLQTRALAGTLTPAELSGGSFTITNLGMYDVDMFTPIINLPETAILGIGRIHEKIVPWQGQPSIRSMVWLSLTFDHRLVDGAPAARFLQLVKRLIEEPLLLMA